MLPLVCIGAQNNVAARSCAIGGSAIRICPLSHGTLVAAAATYSIIWGESGVSWYHGCRGRIGDGIVTIMVLGNDGNALSTAVLLDN